MSANDKKLDQIIKTIEANDIKFLKLELVDIHGLPKSMAVPLKKADDVEDIVNDGCGYCRNPECNVLGTANCLMCKGFITTPKHIAQFEEAITILSQQIIDNENPHDKEHLYAVKRLYTAYLEQLYIRKEEAENATTIS